MGNTRKLEDMPDFLTIEEVAEILRIGRNSAYAAAHKGVFPTFRVGRKMLAPKEGIIKLASVQDNS